MAGSKKHNTFLNLFSTVLLLTALGCNNIERLNTSQISQRMDQYKIKKVSPEEILSQLHVQGNSWKEKLKQNAALICNQNFTVPDSLLEGTEMNLKLIDLDTLQAEGIVSKKERELMQAYKFSYKNGEVLGTNTQLLESDIYLYTFPFEGCPGTEKLLWCTAWEKGALIRSL